MSRMLSRDQGGPQLRDVCMLETFLHAPDSSAYRANVPGKVVERTWDLSEILDERTVDGGSVDEAEYVPHRGRPGPNEYCCDLGDIQCNAVPGYQRPSQGGLADEEPRFPGAEA